MATHWGGRRGGLRSRLAEVRRQGLVKEQTTPFVAVEKTDVVVRSRPARTGYNDPLQIFAPLRPREGMCQRPRSTISAKRFALAVSSDAGERTKIGNL